MRILYATDHRFYPRDGEVFTESQFEPRLWKRFLAEFERLFVVGRQGASSDTPKELRRSSMDGVDFHLLPNISRLSLDARRRASEQMWEVVQSADRVMARLPSEIGLLAVSHAEKAGVPYSVEVAGCPWDGLWNYGSVAGRLYAPILTSRTRRAVRQAPLVWYVTERFLQERYPTTGASIGASGVILEGIHRESLDRRLARIAAPSERTRLGLIGSLNGRVKGIHTILEALSGWPDARELVTFHVLGPGDPSPWQKMAENLGVADLVHFEGTLDGGDPVLRWLDNIDIYLQPSLKEGLPRALVEAMSRGCPALGTRLAGIPELLDDEDLIQPGNSDELRELLRRRLGDQDWRSLSATRNWETSRRFDKAHLTKKYDEFWRLLKKDNV